MHCLRQNTRVTAVGVRPAVTLNCVLAQVVCACIGLRQNTRVTAVGVRPAVTLECLFSV